jgi:hypothetical protein
MQTKPLINLGECMPPSLLNTNKIPDLSTKSTPIGRIGTGTTIIAPMKIMLAHKIVFILAKVAKVLHRDDIANQTETPLASIASTLAKLKQVGVVISIQWGQYTLAKDFLRHFQIAYGTPKTEKLLKMFDEGGIDITAYDVELNDVPSESSKESMLNNIKAYVDAQQIEMATITAEIEKLTKEKNVIAEELAKFGQLANMALAA